MLKQPLRERLREAIARAGLPAPRAIALARPHPPHAGDFSTNVAHHLAGPAGLGPEAVARAIAERLPPDGWLAAVAAAGGYLNFTLTPEALVAGLAPPGAAGAGAPVRLEGPALPTPEGRRLTLYLAAVARLFEATGHPIKFERRDDDKPVGHITVGARTVKVSVGAVRARRAGRGDPWDELLAVAGEGAARHALLSRPLESPVLLDPASAARETLANPYFSLWYAHARLASLGRLARQEGLHPVPDARALDGPLARELALLAGTLADELAEAAEALAPQRLVRYGEAVAEAFHAFDAECRVLVDDRRLAEARLALLAATAQALKAVLEVGLGVPAPATMEHSG